MHEEISIRRARSAADYRACQDAQRRAWGIVEDGYVVPIATLVGAQLHGGLVLGAFLPGGEAVGVSFAFLGRIEGRSCLYSQLTGVVPGYQGLGLGLRLKRVQWEYARAEGLDRLAWAFDPLQAGNAHFNLEKLGASAGRYVEDMYGPRTDALNAGTPTDRLIAEWSTDAPGPRPAASPAEERRRPRLLEATPGPDGLLVPSITPGPTDAPRLLLEIPADVAGLRERNAELADRWRLATRRAFTSAFAAGYRAVGFLREDRDGRRRCDYLLHRTGAGPD